MKFRPSLCSCVAVMVSGLLAAHAAEARTFISPMGEPFRGMPDGKEPAEAWFAGADKNGDGKITRAEFFTDAGRFFKTLDVNHDNEIGPDEIDRYEQEVAPEVQTGGFSGGVGGGQRNSGGGGGGRGHGGGGGRGGGGHGGGGGGGHRGGGGGGDSSSAESGPGPSEPALQGAARFGYLGIPEPVIAADTDFNRGVSPKEFLAAANERFDLLDTNHDGMITRDDLPTLGRPGGDGKGGAGWRRHGPPPSKDDPQDAPKD
jgi:Ca2+-binding EF-hand superfamily protein